MAVVAKCQSATYLPPFLVVRLHRLVCQGRIECSLQLAHASLQDLQLFASFVALVAHAVAFGSNASDVTTKEVVVVRERGHFTIVRGPLAVSFRLVVRPSGRESGR